jgi:hypothetical protein
MKRRVREGSIYELTWWDAKTRYGWHLPRVEARIRCQTVGYVTDQDQHQISVAQTRTEDGAVAEVTTIPRVNLIKITKL